MKFRILVILAFFSSFSLFAQKVTVVSPDKKINIGLFNTKNGESGEWYLKVSYINNGVTTEAIPQIILGLSRADQDFSKELKYLKNSKVTSINEKYTAFSSSLLWLIEYEYFTFIGPLAIYSLTTAVGKPFCFTISTFFKSNTSAIDKLGKMYKIREIAMLINFILYPIYLMHTFC